MRRAEVLDGLGRTADAIETVRTVVLRDPDRLDTYQQDKISLKMGSVKGLAEFLEFGLENAIQPAAREYLTSRLGRILWRELRRPEEADPLLEKPVDIDRRTVPSTDADRSRDGPVRLAKGLDVAQ